eukprot:m.235431 g.235431  ORF g.235431 m.235431 type:complete len:517 (+) comp12826_c0_seq1:264-1814(+)
MPKKTDAALSLHAADWLGFDLDLTFVRYKLEPLSRLIYDCLGRYFVDHCGYSPELLTRGFLEHFPARGLVYHMKLGNFLMLSASGKVVKAFHGSKKMEATEIAQLYSEPLTHVVDKLKLGQRVDGYHVFATFFDTPCTVLVAHFVDIEDTVEKPSYARIFKDFVAAFNFCFEPKNFAANTGGFFPCLKENPSKYLYKMTPAMRTWVANLRSHGVRLFLLTNSQADFSSLLLTYSVGPEWRSLFDLVIVNGSKPDFFTKSNPFRAVSPDLSIGEPVTELELGGMYATGNHKDLNAFILRNSRRTFDLPPTAAVSEAIIIPVVPVNADATVAEAVAKAVAEAEANTAVEANTDAEASGKRKRAEDDVGDASPKKSATEGAVEPADDVTIGSPRAEGPLVVYFGDHPLTDTAAVSQWTDWHAVAILEEMVHRRPSIDGTDCPVRQADAEAALFVGPGCDHWSEFFPSTKREEPLFVEHVLLEHSSLVVPHLDAIAARPFGHEFKVVAADDHSSGLHYHD